MHTRVYTLLSRCLHTLVYSCTLLNTLVYSCTLLYTFLYTLAHSCILLWADVRDTREVTFTLLHIFTHPLVRGEMRDFKVWVGQVYLWQYLQLIAFMYVYTRGQRWIKFPLRTSIHVVLFKACYSGIECHHSLGHMTTVTRFSDTHRTKIRLKL